MTPRDGGRSPAAPPNATGAVWRPTALADAVGRQRLAGLEPSPRTVALLRRVALGGPTVEAVLAQIRAHRGRRPTSE